MAKNTDQPVRGFKTENTGGLLTGFLAEEDELDRSSLWRLGSWGAASVGAVIVALLASQYSIGLQRDKVVATDLVRQSLEIRAVARETQNETRRLASAIDILNSDRDRLYSRVTVLEQGLDSVTGAIARQNSAPASAQAAPISSPETQPVPQSTAAAPAPAASPVATVAPTPEKPRTAQAEQATAPASSPAQGTSNAPATPLMASKSLMAPPDSAAGKLIEPDPVTPPKPEVVANAPPGDHPLAGASQAAAEQAVQRTEFGVDVGGANSLNGLRALWRGLLKSKSTASLATLRPIIVVKENNTGLGMQLRLVAGPLNDAAAAAKICAVLIENQRACETAVFDGQRLAMKADEPAASSKPAGAKPVARRRRAMTSEDPPKGSTPSMLSSVFGGR
ncbi:MAG TPA: hypothetical protein VFI51_00095 [Bradyrhizobium sp.]|nr:hypothetical protein [Bradyrhizobium sp.]